MQIENIWNLTRSSTFETLTDELINKAEKELNFQLPKKLIELLKIKNGGISNILLLHSRNSNIWRDRCYEIDELYGINDGKSKNLGILSTSYLISEWELPEKQVIIEGDGHWWITLYYRNNSREPIIKWIEPEAERDEIIANNFEEFITQLKSEYTN